MKHANSGNIEIDPLLPTEFRIDGVKSGEQQGCSDKVRYVRGRDADWVVRKIQKTDPFPARHGEAARVMSASRAKADIGRSRRLE